VLVLKNYSTFQSHSRDHPLIQMDFGALLPIPTGSFWKFFPSFWVPDLQGHFEALNKVFRDCHIQIMDKVGV
jgi:hypothetical protein